MSTQPENSTLVEEWAKQYFFQTLTEFFNNLKNSELSLLQAYALSYLYFKGPTRITELCEHMTVSPGAASQLVDRLEKLEMVERIADPQDRRVRNVRVLEKGVRFMQEGFRFSQAWIVENNAGISPEQESQITSALALLLESFNAKQPV